MARVVTRVRGRVRVVGMAMPGRGLPTRVRQMFTGLPPAPPSRARLVGTVVFCSLTSVMFAAGTLGERARGLQSQGQSTSAAAPMHITFEAVAIRPCEDSAPTGGRGGGGPRYSISPGYVSWGCVTLEELIENAWGGGSFPNNDLANTIRVPPGQRPDAPKRVRGGPSWIDSDKFAIEIRISGDTTDATGSVRHNQVANAMIPQLRAMLADRFQLKLRKAAEEQPMYALTIAKSGFHLDVSAPDKCWKPEDYPRPPGLSRMDVPPPPPGWEGIPPCGYNAHARRRTGNESIDFEHITLAQFAKYLSGEMDRYVLDQTNTPGRFSFTLEYAPDDSTPGVSQSREMFARAGAELLRRTPTPDVKGDGPTIFKALESIGLHLEKTKGPAEYLLIESAQRPKPAFAKATAGKPNRP